MKKSNILYSLLVAGVLMVFSGVALAAPPPPPTSPGCWPPPCTVPVDGGISILLAAGALYAGKKIFNATQNPE